MFREVFRLEVFQQNVFMLKCVPQNMKCSKCSAKCVPRNVGVLPTWKMCSAKYVLQGKCVPRNMFHVINANHCSAKCVPSENVFSKMCSAKVLLGKMKMMFCEMCSAKMHCSTRKCSVKCVLCKVFH